VALGDSVVSGEGTYYGWHWDGSAWQRSTTTDPTWEDSSIAGQHCHLSKNGYPYLVAFNKNLNLTDLGCTGARAVLGVLSAQDFGGGVVADYPQLGDPDLYGPADPNYDDAQPDIVSLTVGADDIDFSGWIEQCYGLLNRDCGNSTDTSDINTDVSMARSDLHDVLSEIHSRGQAAGKIPHVYVTGYYDPFPSSYVSGCKDLSPTLGTGINSTEMSWLRTELENLNTNIHDEADHFGNVTFVDLSSVMSGHEFCSSDPRVYGASLRVDPTTTPPSDNHNPAPYHPTPAGQQAIAQAIQAAMTDGTNYVTNGGFEGGNTNGWSATNAPAVTTSQAHTGTHSMTFTGSFDVTDSPNNFTTQTADIAQADFWAKGPAGKTVRVKLREYLTGGNNELYQSFTLTGGWDHFVSQGLHLYNTGSSGVDFNIDNPSAGSSDVFYLDDIKELGYAATESCGYQNLLNGLNADAVENCGGEAAYGTQYWAGDSSTTLSADTADAHDGHYSFKLVANSSGTMTMNDSPDVRDVGEVSSSATSCTATAWMKAPSGGSRSLKLRLREYNANQGGLKGTATATATPNGSWQQLSVTRTLASGHDSNTHLDLNPYMTNASSGDVVRVDHVTETCQ